MFEAEIADFLNAARRLREIHIPPLPVPRQVARHQIVAGADAAAFRPVSLKNKLAQTFS